MSLKKGAASFLQKFEQNFLQRKPKSFSSVANMGENSVVAKEEVERFVSECLKSVGAMDEDSKIVGHHLMTADYRGHYSHGLNRLEMYVRDIRTKTTDPHAKPEVVQDFKAVALVDGHNALGHVIGKFCMELAISKAREFGIGMVSARGSNHYGICGYYSLMAAEKRMIGISCTNTSPIVAPTRSKQAAIGTNPLSVAMRGSKDEFCLDMANSVVALGKIEMAKRKNESIPAGWALNKEGQITQDPAEAYDALTLMPLGGDEIHGGYKGYGLGLAVELLCGVLSGGHYGPNIRRWEDKDSTEPADLGQFFLAIDPDALGTGAGERLDHILGQMRELPKTKEEAVKVAGDPERESMRKVDQEGGISYHKNLIENLAQFAKTLNVEAMKMTAKKC